MQWKRLLSCALFMGVSGITPSFALIFPIYQNQGWSYQLNKNNILQHTYSFTGHVKDGFAITGNVEQNQMKYGMINAKGEVLFEPKFDSISSVSEGYFVVKLGKLFGYASQTGKLTIYPRFQAAYAVKNGFGRAMKDSLFGYILPTGRSITGFKYLSAFDFADNRALVRHTNSPFYHFINTTGETVSPTNLVSAYGFSDTLAAAAVYANPLLRIIKWGFLDKSGQWAIAPKLDSARPFHHGAAPARQRLRWGLIDTNAEWIVQPQYQNILYMKQGFFSVQQQDDSWMLVNHQGQFLVSNSFDRIYPFSGPTARVQKDGAWGLLSTNGTYKLSQYLDWIGPFVHGIASFRVDNYYGYIQDTGAILVKPMSLSSSSFDGGYGILTTKKANSTLYTVSYINTRGQTLWEFDLDPNQKNQTGTVLSVVAFPEVDFYKRVPKTLNASNQRQQRYNHIMSMPYGSKVYKEPQNTAVQTSGHGTLGYWSEVQYLRKEGVMFSETLSMYPAPELGMGLTAYFDTLFAPIGMAENKTFFFFGGNRVRTYNRGKTIDTYTLPNLSPTEGLFVMMASLGSPIDTAPVSSVRLDVVEGASKGKTASLYVTRGPTGNISGFNYTVAKQTVRAHNEDQSLKVVHTY